MHCATDPCQGFAPVGTKKCGSNIPKIIKSIQPIEIIFEFMDSKIEVHTHSRTLQDPWKCKLCVKRNIFEVKLKFNLYRPAVGQWVFNALSYNSTWGSPAVCLGRVATSALSSRVCPHFEKDAHSWPLENRNKSYDILLSSTTMSKVSNWLDTVGLDTLHPTSSVQWTRCITLESILSYFRTYALQSTQAC